MHRKNTNKTKIDKLSLEVYFHRQKEYWNIMYRGMEPKLEKYKGNYALSFNVGKQYSKAFVITPDMTWEEFEKKVGYLERWLQRMALRYFLRYGKKVRKR